MGHHSFPSVRTTQASIPVPRTARSGYSLLEVMCVLGVSGLLLAIHTRGLATTRPVSTTFQCLNNQRLLACAWRMYADDNSTKLPPNTDGTMAGKNANSRSWTGGWLDYTSSTDNTNVDLLVNPQKYPDAGHLGPYLRSPAVFRCPADETAVRFFGILQKRVRSVSMNNAFGYNSRTWLSPSRYRIYALSGQIGNPAGLFVFLDEHPGSINDATFLVNPDTPGNMIDFPGTYHNGGANFSFADGHTEHHKWQDPRTMPAVNAGTTIPLNVMLTGDPDVRWIQQHSSELW
jgi:prepilin-type processing-associated H-X9-DG protein/prepilin-type N-terminal cleavage/methylation domain-containing protein